MTIYLTSVCPFDIQGYSWITFYIPSLHKISQETKRPGVSILIQILSYLEMSHPWSISGLSHVQTFPVQQNAARDTNSQNQRLGISACVMCISKLFIKHNRAYCLVLPLPVARLAGGEALALGAQVGGWGGEGGRHHCRGDLSCIPLCSPMQSWRGKQSRRGTALPWD